MELSNYSKIFKALSNEQRLKIFLMIYKQCCAPQKGKETVEFKVNDKACCPAAGILDKAFTKICGCISLSRSTISHHFKELQNAGLITCEREGKIFRCKVNEKAIEAVREFLK